MIISCLPICHLHPIAPPLINDSSPNKNQTKQNKTQKKNTTTNISFRHIRSLRKRTILMMENANRVSTLKWVNGSHGSPLSLTCIDKEQSHYGAFRKRYLPPHLLNLLLGARQFRLRCDDSPGHILFSWTTFGVYIPLAKSDGKVHSTGHKRWCSTSHP